MFIYSSILKVIFGPLKSIFPINEAVSRFVLQIIEKKVKKRKFIGIATGLNNLDLHSNKFTRMVID